MNAAASLRPHDLLFLRAPAVFEACAAGAPQPDWLDAAWLASAPLVVRRARAGAGRIAVGARGLTRSQRCAGQVDAAAVARTVTPEMLARAVLSGLAQDAASAGLPCIAALVSLAPRLETLGLAWGPAGGAGFWLASGLPVLRADSDLDLLVRAPRRLTPTQVQALCELQPDAPCRLDIQVDTGFGAFALAEYARGGRVLLKTADGPLLVVDTWAPRAREAA